jgi:hypothetical protein
MSGLPDRWDSSERYFEPASEKLEGEPPPASIARPHDSGADLLDKLVRFVRRYAVVSDVQVDAVALWVLHTYTFQVAEASPYLAVMSPEMRCGKTTLLKVIEQLCRSPWRVITPSEAVLYRKIARDRPTIMLDEIETVFGRKSARENEPLRALFNAGNEPGTVVPRVGGPNRDRLDEFPVYCPKAFAGIGVDELPATIRDRSIVLNLKRRAPSETIERFRTREVELVAEPLRVAAAAWAEATLGDLERARPVLPDALDDRAADGWEPLLAIADLAGGDWPDRARAAAIALSTAEGREEDSLGVRLLGDTRRVYDEQGTDRLASAALAIALVAIEEAPWGDLRGHPLNTRGLARMLKRYDIRPRTIRLDDGSTPKGYLREQFEDLWHRYLPNAGDVAPPPIGAPAATPPQPASLSEKPGESIHYRTPVVADPEGGANPHQQTDVADVADTTPLPGDEGFRDLLNRAHEAGQITHQERHQRRITHDLIRRMRQRFA